VAKITLNGTSGDVLAVTFTGSGVNLTALNGDNIASGTVAAARIAANTPTNGNRLFTTVARTFLRIALH